MDRRTKLREFIIAHFLYGRNRSLSDAASLRDEGIVDSTGLMALVAFLEQAYNVKVGDEELVPANFDTIERLDAYIGRKLVTQ